MTTFISVFTGIAGFDLGFEQAGMTCVAQVENNAAALQVLDYHYPNVPKIKDVSHAGRHNLPDTDVVCGGFPCQDVSHAGRRAGLAGERSGLYFEFQRLVVELKPRCVVIENVPGLLTSNAGKDFAVVLGGLTGVIPAVPKRGWKYAGVARGRSDLYRVAWRVLDSQYFGVAQRRERVFIVGCLGDGRAAEILFERAGGGGGAAARSAAGQNTAAPLKAGSPSRRNGGSSPVEGEFVVYGTPQITICQNSSNPQVGSPVNTPQSHAHAPLLAGTLGAAHGQNRGLGQENEIDSLISADIAGTVTSGANGVRLSADEPGMLVASALTTKSPSRILRGDGTDNIVQAVNFNASVTSDQPVRKSGKAGALSKSRREGIFSLQMGARRLTPLECERLQGFPDGWTAVMGKLAQRMTSADLDYLRAQYARAYGVILPDDKVRRIISDSARYARLGNAVTVTVARWLGTRILKVMTYADES